MKRVCLMRVRLKRVLRATRGVAGLEFALIAPVMFLMVAGVFDMSKGIILWQQVYNAAHTIPVSASILSVQPDKTTSLTVEQVQETTSAIYAEMPWLRDGIEQGQRSVTLTSVTFTQTNPICVPLPLVPCPYTASVAWSVPYKDSRGTGGVSGFTQVVRACGNPTQVAPTQQLTKTQTPLTVLRTLNISAPDPILVADVHYQYTPMFLRFLTGPLDFWATGYWSVRTGDPAKTVAQQYTRYDIANAAGGANKCAGFP